MARTDLTDWIIHFVHKRNANNDPMEFSYDEEGMEHVPIPDNFTYEGGQMFQTNRYEEDEYGLEYDAGALSVLKKILHDGIIRTGWSFRNFSPTIYGPKAAACFTEMPLHALVEYSKSRNNDSYVEPYGIAFLKQELFEAGARPVIYGLSGKHIEAGYGDKHYNIGLRTLREECGIGLREMYRYVYTSIKSAKRVDWTHEREWRWADLDAKFEFPGLPFFAKNEEFTFSKVIVIVKSKDEVEDVVDHLQHLFHSESTNYCREYDLEVIANTYVLSIDELAELKLDVETVKLDDLPLNSIPKLQKIAVREETIEKVKAAVERAYEIYYAEVDRKFKELGDNVGISGWGQVVTYVSNSEITQALIDAGLASSYGTGCYYVSLGRGYPVQSLDLDEAGKIKAAQYLTRELGQSFTTHARID